MRFILALVLLAQLTCAWCQSFSLADVPRPPGASARFGAFIIGALASGKPTAILRLINATAKGDEIRLEGNVVAVASQRIFSAADPGAGTVQAALDVETIYHNGMEF